MTELEKKIEEAFDLRFRQHTGFPPGPNEPMTESQKWWFKAGYEAAMEEMKPKVKQGYCIVCGKLENLHREICQRCNQQIDDASPLF